MSEPVFDQFYRTPIEPADIEYYRSPVDDFFGTAGVSEGVLIVEFNGEREVMPVTLASDGEGHGFAMKRETGE